jgi:hypothetical protein
LGKEGFLVYQDGLTTLTTVQYQPKTPLNAMRIQIQSGFTNGQMQLGHLDISEIPLDKNLGIRYHRYYLLFNIYTRIKNL